MNDLKPCPFCGGTKLKIDRKSRLAGWNGLDMRVEMHTYLLVYGQKRRVAPW